MPRRIRATHVANHLDLLFFMFGAPPNPPCLKPIPLYPSSDDSILPQNGRRGLSIRTDQFYSSSPTITMQVFWHLNCSLTYSNFDPFQDIDCNTKLGLFFHSFLSNARKGVRKVAPRRVSILLTLFIFGVITRAWCDPVKSINGAAIQLTTMKAGENKAGVQTKTKSAKGPAEWSKKSQARLSDMNLLRAQEERKKPQMVESLDEVIYSREFSENVWRNIISNPLHARETKSSRSDSGQSALRAYPGENGSSEQSKTFTKLKLLQSKEETSKEIFMGVCFSFDLTNGHVFLEMNVTPSSEKRSGFSIRF